LLGLPELLTDPRFARNADRVQHNAELVSLMAARFTTQPSAHWLDALEKCGIPAGPVLHYDEVYNDPQILAREMVVETRHPVTGAFKTMGVPVKLSATPGSVRTAAPRLGEHSDTFVTRKDAAE
jgi:crotonobetainyl-CoA:carnitine CoA-transferase CaiB-like acyl-CoA transferase